MSRYLSNLFESAVKQLFQGSFRLGLNTLQLSSTLSLNFSQPKHMPRARAKINSTCLSAAQSGSHELCTLLQRNRGVGGTNFMSHKRQTRLCNETNEALGSWVSNRKLLTRVSRGQGAPQRACVEAAGSYEILWSRNVLHAATSTARPHFWTPDIRTVLR